ncbi:MAG: DEAD/DEAH box helicase [Myxococcota bacterium]
MSSASAPSASATSSSSSSSAAASPATRPAADRARAESGFARFQLDARLLRALADAGFSSPRPIQVETLPACLDGQDVLGLAQTGTGKTAAFALPILQRLIEEPGRGPLVLILAPTRELAIQIDAEIRRLARHTDIETTTVFGGISPRSQAEALRRRPEIVVGCPGRVLDLIRQRVFDPSFIDTLVLDEADHMFDMGFLPDVTRILDALPKDRQNLLFSATMPPPIRKLANRILDRPHVVELANARPAAQIEHFLYEIAEGQKRSLLERVLAAEDCRTAIVFTRTKHRAKRMALQLDAQGHRAVALQGNMSQAQRDRAMQGFREGRFDVLVATDIAARGIDVADVDYVVNFDPPSTPDTYTHRIGRTGRSDANGRAVTFVTSEDRAWVRDTERVLGAPIPRLSAEGLATRPALDTERGTGRSRDGRPVRARTSSRADTGASERTGEPGRGRGRSRRRSGSRGRSGGASASGSPSRVRARADRPLALNP